MDQVFVDIGAMVFATASIYERLEGEKRDATSCSSLLRMLFELFGMIGIKFKQLYTASLLKAIEKIGSLVRLSFTLMFSI